MVSLAEGDIRDLLSGADDELLFKRAAEIREQVFGKDVYLRAVIEFSNYCNKKCQYCGLRAPNREAVRYRMPRETMMDAAEAAALGEVGTIVLQSGDDFKYSREFIGDLVREIKEKYDLAVTLSLGDRKLEEYKYWRECGADRCLVKLETTDRDLYDRFRMGESFEERLQRVENLRDFGYEVGSGVIVGLPGMTIETTAKDIEFLSTLDLDMIAAGPFIPHPQTPLADCEIGDIPLSHRVTALLRVLNPPANIPATSALSALDSVSQGQALQRGCNVLMPSMTPEEHRSDYSIYPGKNKTHATASASLESAKSMVRSLGFVPSKEHGFSKRKTHVE
jgi:biotin synthase